MAAIVVKQFGGVAPRTPPRFLPDTAAQVALNCPAWLGSLSGLPGTSKIRNTDKTGVKSIYRFGQDVISDTQYWFEFTTYTDVVRSQISGDTSERTFWTDGVKPKKTDFTMALTGGTHYPINSYDLGVPAPATIPSVSPTDVTGTAVGIPETRIYTDTFVTIWGEESQPSGPSSSVDVGYPQTVTLNSLAPVPTGHSNITTRRIYRLATGTGSSEYLLVAEIDATLTSYTDSTASADLGEVIPSTDWAEPPDALQGLVSMPNGMMAGFVGRDVYFCDPYHPFAWPATYIQTVDYPVVGLGVMDTTLAVLTTGVPFFIQGTHPDSTSMVKSDIHQACVSKQSIVSMDGVVYYASPDGIVKLSSNGSGLVTDQMFRRDQWQTIKPESIRAYNWESKYVAFYDTGTVKGGFVFDPASMTFIWHDMYCVCGYNDLQRDKLFLVTESNELHEWYAGSAKSYEWKSKKFTLPAPTTFSFAQVEAEAYPVTFKAYFDGALCFTKSVTTRSAFRLPSARYRDIEFEVAGTPEVFAVAIAQSAGELLNA